MDIPAKLYDFQNTSQTLSCDRTKVAVAYNPEFNRECQKRKNIK